MLSFYFRGGVKWNPKPRPKNLRTAYNFLDAICICWSPETWAIWTLRWCDLFGHMPWFLHMVKTQVGRGAESCGIQGESCTLRKSNRFVLWRLDMFRLAWHLSFRNSTITKTEIRDVEVLDIRHIPTPCKPQRLRNVRTEGAQAPWRDLPTFSDHKHGLRLLTFFLILIKLCR